MSNPNFHVVAARIEVLTMEISPKESILDGKGPVIEDRCC
jgi:hypothetical protein